MNETLKGKWAYRSYYHDPIVVNNNQIEGNPQLATPWTPPGELQADTDGEGNVTATLTFTGVPTTLKVTGRVIPAAGKLPASVELTGEGGSAIYQIKGFFIPGSTHVVGTTMSSANDLARQPVGTLGPFVLFPLDTV